MGPLPGTFAHLEFRQFLGRFIDVCDAVAYAHSRGVLHRDRTPRPRLRRLVSPCPTLP
jgi:serine/threonine protein kinase